MCRKEMARQKRWDRTMKYGGGYVEDSYRAIVGASKTVQIFYAIGLCLSSSIHSKSKDIVGSSALIHNFTYID